jgi:SAM-dependent methyltransferase
VAETVPQALIDAAEAYERLFVPALFGQWAPRVADAAGIGPGDRVLDVACGTGVLAREAASRVGPSGSVAGLDANPGMLAVARRRSPQIDWQQGSAERLPYTDRSFDRVVSQFGLMFFGDRTGAVREMLRVLRPVGRIAVAVWDAIERAPGFADEAALFERLIGREAADAVRTPFALGDRAELERLFGVAGAAEIAVSTQRGTARFPDVQTMVVSDLRGWLPAMGVLPTEAQIERVVGEADRALRAHVAPDGSIAFDAHAHVVTCARR